MDLNYFKNKYKVNSSRLQNWDYGFNGLYFITICTKDRKNYFGEVRGGLMGLSLIGCVVCDEWFKTGSFRKNVRLDEFIIMPNHIHGIIEIFNDMETLQRNVSAQYMTGGQDINNNKQSISSNNTKQFSKVETLRCNVSLENKKGQHMSNISPKSGSLSTIIRSFKSACANQIHKLGYEFSWQERFYDHLIRTDTESLEKIRYYIKYNSQMWDRDINNLENLI